MKLTEIHEIFITQKEALNAQELGIERELLPNLPDIKSHALVISGIRRCGKSTLLHQLINKLNRDFFYFNFDDFF